MIWFSVAALLAAGYCISRSIVDIREKRYVWGGIGILSAAFFLSAPIETHAIKLDLPVPTGG